MSFDCVVKAVNELYFVCCESLTFCCFWILVGYGVCSVFALCGLGLVYTLMCCCLDVVCRGYVNLFLLCWVCVLGVGVTMWLVLCGGFVVWAHGLLLFWLRCARLGVLL